MKMEQPRASSDHAMMDDMAEFAVQHPEINRNTTNQGCDAKVGNEDDA